MTLPMLHNTLADWITYWMNILLVHMCRAVILLLHE